MVKLVNRARMTTVSIGTGTLTLGVAVDGFQSFVAAGVANGDVVRYVIEEGSAWEIGTGTYASSGTALTRNVSESSAGGSPISLNGTAIVSLVLTAADLAGKADAGDPRFADAREWTASTVTQAEAEAGTATTRRAWSIRLDQAAFFTQFRFALMSALASSMSFRMSAVRATFGGFPALIMA